MFIGENPAHAHRRQEGLFRRAAAACRQVGNDPDAEALEAMAAAEGRQAARWEPSEDSLSRWIRQTEADECERRKANPIYAW